MFESGKKKLFEKTIFACCVCQKTFKVAYDVDRQLYNHKFYIGS